MTTGVVSSSPVFRTHQERLLVERGRLFLWTTIVIVVGMWGLNASGLVRDTSFSLPVLNSIELCVLTVTVTQLRWPWCRRHILGVSVAYCVQLVACVVLYGMWTGDLWILSLRLAALILAMAAVLPWGVAAQGVVAAVSTLGFAFVHWSLNGTLDHPSTIPTFVLFAVSLPIAFWLLQAHADIATEVERRRAAEGVLRQATEGAQVAVWDSDLGTGKVRLVSGWDRLLGRYEDEIALVDLLDLVHVDDRAKTTAALQEHLQGHKSPHDIEHRMLHADGSYRWVLSRSAISWDAQGRPYRLQGAVMDITDRKRLDEALQTIEVRKHVEEVLRESEERYRGHFEQAAIGIAFVGLDGRYLRVNQRLCDIVGYTEPELRTRTFQDITHPDYRGRDRGAMRDMLDGKIQMHSLEKRYMRKDGSSVWVELTVSLVREPSGHPKYFIAVVEDIDARKRAESERERLFLFLDSIVENIPNMVFVKDAKDLRYVLFNRAGAEPFGYARADLIGKNDYELLPKEEADFFTEKDRTVLSDKTLLDIPEERISTVHRGERILHTKKIPILDDKGEPAYLLGISEDITERKRAQEALKLHGTIVDTMSEGVCLIRASDAAIIYANARFEATFGYGPGELDGRPVTTLNASGEQSAEAVAQEIQRALRKNGAWRGEVRNRKKDGTAFWGQSSVSTFQHSQHGDVWVAVHTDITERKHAEETRNRLFEQVSAGQERLAVLSRRLMEVQEAERRHLARELHDEIGQYLTGMGLLVDQLNRQPPDSVSAPLAEVRKLLDDLIVRVRNLSLDLRPAMLDDFGLLAALLWLFGRFSKQTNIEIDFHHSKLDRRFSQEVETATYRIVQEALTNVARHAGVSKASVHVSADHHLLSVMIVDHGKGFDPDAVLGTGAAGGLLGMRERVVFAGGRLRVDSAVGTGTRVHAEFQFTGSS
jgi:PAS domain S-box-containing protein